MVLRHSLTFKSNLSHFEAFLRDLSSIERFFKVLRRSMMFWDVHSVSEAPSFDLNNSQRLLKNLRHYLVVLGCFEDFWRFLGHFNEFLAVMTDSIKFWGVLWHCMLVPRRSEILSWVLIGSERFLIVLRHSPMFLRVLRRFWAVLCCSRRFWDILWHFDVFWDVLMGLRGSELSFRFWGVLWHEGVSLGVRMRCIHYGVFRFVLNRSFGF